MIDLHCHSKISDGGKSPSELVEMGFELGLRALALTDHDTIDGLEEFLSAGARHPEMECVPGVELACTLSCGDYCHIVGLFVDPSSRCLRETCANFARWRDERNRKLIARLCELGYPVTYEEVVREKGSVEGPHQGVVGRPHIAYALLRKGYFKTKEEIFKKVINRGCPGYVARQVLSIEDCVSSIHGSGGIAIWAHPMSSRGMTNAKCERNLQEMCLHGLDGIEAYYAEHSETQVRSVLSLARRHNLLVSGGSDYHGTCGNRLSLGIGYGKLHVPDDLLIAMKQAVTRIRSRI